MKRKFTKQHRTNISRACKGRTTWSKGKKMPKESLYKNMKAHLKYDVDLAWLMKFEDVEKLKYLNKSISRKRDYQGFNNEIYCEYIEKFYNDKAFNYYFDKWVETGDKWIKPSLDHIEAKSNGGSKLVNNLQFLSWFENRAKNDISQVKWNEMKKNIKDYLL